MAGRRPPSIALVAAACAGASAWFSTGAVAVIDAAPGAPRVGILPPLWILAALVLTAVTIAWLARLPADRAWPLFFPLLTVIPWLPGSLPLAALVWTGPVVLFVWVVTLVALVCAAPIRLRPTLVRILSDRSRAPLIATAAAFILYVGAAAHLSFRVTGDEPHYLIITQSILHDFDLRIENNHRAAQYTSYFHGELKPDFLRRGRDGQIYSIHAPGVSVLIAPAFALFGHYGAVVLLALLCAAASALVWSGSALLTGDAPAAWFGWASVTLTVPVFFQAFAIYPEGIGAAAVMCGVFALLDRDAPVHRWFWYGAALALLPWLHTRLAVSAAVLGGAIVLRLGARADRRRAMGAFIAVPLVSAIGWFAFFYAVYGSINPASPYAGNTQSAPSNIVPGLAGLLVDQQFGILPHAPVLGLAFVGFIPFARRHRRLAVETFCVFASYALVATSFHMWWGGRSAPGRFLVAVLLPLALPAACAFDSVRTRGTRLLMVLMLAVSLAVTAVLLIPDHGRLIFNARDGFALWLEWIAPLVDLPRAMPSVLRDGVARALFDAGIWIALCGAAFTVLRVRRATATQAGADALLICTVCSIAVMVALTVLWAARGVHQPTATTAQVELLRQAALTADGTAVKFNPFQRVTVGAAIGRLQISASRRRPTEIDSPDLMLSGVPAGVYRVRLHQAGDSRTLQALVGDSDIAIETWAVAVGGRDAEMRLTLPVPVSSIALRRDPESSNPLDVSLQPVTIPPRHGSGPALAAARYGSTRAFLVQGWAYFEAQGLWLSAGRAEILFDPPAHSLFLRNTNHDNVVTIKASGLAERLELRSREERAVMLPPSAEAAAAVTIDVSEGVVPAVQEPGSGDYRNLGVWVEVTQYRTTPPK